MTYNGWTPPTNKTCRVCGDPCSETRKSTFCYKCQIGIPGLSESAVDEVAPIDMIPHADEATANRIVARYVREAPSPGEITTPTMERVADRQEAEEEIAGISGEVTMTDLYGFVILCDSDTLASESTNEVPLPQCEEFCKRGTEHYQGDWFFVPALVVYGEIS